MDSPYRMIESKEKEDVKTWYIVRRAHGVPYITSGRLGWVDPEWQETHQDWYRIIMEGCDGVIETTIVGTFTDAWRYCIENADRTGGKL